MCIRDRIKEGGWGEYNGNKYYKNPATGFPYKNQWVTFGRTWYYANSQGFMVSGWQTIGGYKYYFYSDTKYMARNVIIEGLSIGCLLYTSNISSQIGMVMLELMHITIFCNLHMIKGFLEEFFSLVYVLWLF